MGRRKRLRPSKEALEAEYRNRTIPEVADVFGVSEATMRRWFAEAGIVGRTPGTEATRPERRRGGRRYKRTGKLPQHVTLEQAERMRQIRAANPDMSILEVRDAAGASCSKEMARLVIAGKRVLPPKPKKAPKAPLIFGRVSKSE